MKIISKRHIAKVVKGQQNPEGGISLELVIQDEGEIVEQGQQMSNEDDVGLKKAAQEMFDDNLKFKRIALAGQKIGDEVILLVKYLVE